MTDTDNSDLAQAHNGPEVEQTEEIKNSWGWSLVVAGGVTIGGLLLVGLLELMLHLQEEGIFQAFLGLEIIPWVLNVLKVVSIFIDAAAKTAAIVVAVTFSMQFNLIEKVTKIVHRTFLNQNAATSQLSASLDDIKGTVDAFRSNTDGLDGLSGGAASTRLIDDQHADVVRSILAEASAEKLIDLNARVASLEGDLASAQNALDLEKAQNLELTLKVDKKQRALETVHAIINGAPRLAEDLRTISEMLGKDRDALDQQLRDGLSE